MVPACKDIEVSNRTSEALKLIFLTPGLARLFQALLKGSWQANPHLMPKESTSLLRSIDMRPVNAATKSERLPMPKIETKLSDFKDNKCFASLAMPITSHFL